MCCAGLKSSEQQIVKCAMLCDVLRVDNVSCHSIVLHGADIMAERITPTIECQIVEGVSIYQVYYSVGQEAGALAVEMSRSNNS